MTMQQTSTGNFDIFLTAIRAINTAIEGNGVLEPKMIVAINAAIVLGPPPAEAEKPLKMPGVNHDPGTWAHYSAAITWVVASKITLNDARHGRKYFWVLDSMKRAFKAELRRIEERQEAARQAAASAARAEKEAKDAAAAAAATAMSEADKQRIAKHRSQQLAEQNAMFEALQGLHEAGEYSASIKPVAVPPDTKPVVAPEQPRVDRPTFGSELTVEEIRYRFKNGCTPETFRVMARVLCGRAMKSPDRSKLLVEVETCCVVQLTLCSGSAKGAIDEARRLVDGFVEELTPKSSTTEPPTPQRRQQGGFSGPQYGKGQNTPTTTAKPAPAAASTPVVESTKNAAASDEGAQEDESPKNETMSDADQTKSPKDADRVDVAAVNTFLRNIGRPRLDASETPKDTKTEQDMLLLWFKEICTSPRTVAEVKRALARYGEHVKKMAASVEDRQKKEFGEGNPPPAAKKQEQGKNKPGKNKPGKNGHDNGQQNASA